jgi:hypothetical protein
MMKKVLTIMIITLMITSTFAYGDITTIYEEIEEDYVNKGVFHQTIERYTDKGKVQINILKITLDNYNEIKPIYNKEGIKDKKVLSQLILDSGAVAGINGDFYNPSYPSYPVGALFNRDDLISSPNNRDYEYPTLIKKGNDYLIDVLEDMINLKTENGETIQIAAVNKMGTFVDEVVILNGNWGEKSIGKYKDNNLLEVLVFQGRIREIRESGEPFDIPEETGYVIVTNGENKEKITDMLEIGTRVELEYNFDLNDMNWGIGTVNYLLKEGNLYKTNSMVSGRQPRSAVAVNEDRDEMYFIAVDGRNANSVGFTQEDLADFIIEIGGYEAVNLDGGGSTTLASERYDSVVVLNRPSDGRERGIVSGLGVFSNYDKTDKDVEFIKSKLEDRYYFPNQKFNINVTGYNEDRIPVEIDQETLNVSSDLKSNIIKESIIFEEDGKAEIKIKYGELENSENQLGNDGDKYLKMSKILYDLGLFSGVSAKEFSPNLEGSMNRQEAMKMVVSALGWETEAPEDNPFTDVSDWAKPYVATAYNRGITLGTAPDENIFGATDPVTKTQLLTFYLRALGYESNYAYNNAERLGEFTGISQNLSGETNNLKRYDLVAVTYDTLKTTKRYEDTTIIEKLAKEEIVDEELAKRNGLIKENKREETLRVKVIEGPYELRMENESINIGKNEKFKFDQLKGIGEKGFAIDLNVEDIEWSYDRNLGEIDGEYFISSDVSGSGYIEGRFNEAYIKIPIVVGYEEETFFGFEDLENLRYEEYPEGSGGNMVLESESVEGSSSLKLNYDFTSMVDGDQAIAFVNFGEDGLELPGEPTALNLSVFGDEKNHWLRTRVIDADGNMHKIDFAEKVNWTGWKEVTARIPSEIKYPIKLQNIYIAEIYDDMKDSGSIYLDDLKLLYPEKTNGDNEIEKSKYEDKYKAVPEIYNNKLEFIDEKMYLDDSQETYENNQRNLIYYELMIEDGSILGSIEDIKELSLENNKKIVINMDNPIENLNQNEYNGFVKLMEQAFGNDSEVIVVHKGETSNILYENGFRYIEYEDDLTLYINEGNFYYKIN